MVNPIDQASILRGGQLLVPDYAAQEVQRRQLAIQEQQAGLQAQRQQQAIMEAQREQRQAEAFQAAMDDYLVEPDSPMAARKMAGLLGRFPQFREQIEGAWKGLDGAKQSSDMRALGNIYALGESGNFEAAANEIQRRIDAETAAGQQPDPTDLAMAQALKSGDPVQQRAAIRQAGLLLEVASGGKITTTAKPTADQQNYEWRVATFGREYADRVQQVQDDKFVPVQGKGIYRGSDFAMPGLISGYGGGTFDTSGRQVTPSQYGMEGGDPASSGGQQPIAFEDFQRLQASMGADKAAAYVRSQGIPVMGPGTQVRSVDRGNPIPVPVKTKQQYEKLPSGAQYIAPDGSLRRKP